MSLISPSENEWRGIRADGKRSYIRRAGLKEFALGTGLTVWLLVVVVIPTLFAEDAPNLEYFGSPMFWISTLAAIVIWPIAGIIVANLLWRKYERKWGKTQD